MIGLRIVRHGAAFGKDRLMTIPFIVVYCGSHKYVFYYKTGREDEVISQMIDYAMDERHVFGWAEVRSIMKHFGLLTQPPSAPPPPPHP